MTVIQHFYQVKVFLELHLGSRDETLLGGANHLNWAPGAIPMEAQGRVARDSYKHMYCTSQSSAANNKHITPTTTIPFTTDELTTTICQLHNMPASEK
jgi:hypothetical protein